MFDFLLDIGNYDQRKVEVDNISGNGLNPSLAGTTSPI